MTRYTVFWEPIQEDWTVSVESTKIEVSETNPEEQDLSTTVEWEDTTLDKVDSVEDNESDKNEVTEDVNEEDTISNLNKDERKLTDITDDLSDDLKDIEDLLNVEIENSNEEWEQKESWTTEWLEKAFKTIKTLQNKVEKARIRKCRVSEILTRCNTGARSSYT